LKLSHGVNAIRTRRKYLASIYPRNVGIIVTLLAAIGFWLYHSPGHSTSIEQPAHSPDK
jgi:hypothetical protein